MEIYTMIFLDEDGKLTIICDKPERLKSAIEQHGLKTGEFNLVAGAPIRDNVCDYVLGRESD